jgi:hypothetical protein
LVSTHQQEKSMAQVINTGGGDSSAGVVLGIFVAAAVIVGGYMLLVRDDIGNGSGPNINIEAPSVPASSAD